jgi:hypothetical protein
MGRRKLPKHDRQQQKIERRALKAQRRAEQKKQGRVHARADRPNLE